jgi:hypothetical protein
MTTMAGVAGDAGVGDMRLPLLVDVPGHLDHPPGDDLAVVAVVGEIRAVVAVAILTERSTSSNAIHPPAAAAAPVYQKS